MPRISKKYLEFVQELKKVITTIEAEEGNFGVSAEKLVELKTGETSYDGFFDAYVLPNRGEADVKNIADSYKAVRALLSAVQQGIKNNPNYVLSDAQKVELYIHIDSPRRSYVPVPSFLPAVNALKIQHGLALIEVSVVDAEEGFNNLRLPKDVAGIFVAWEVVEKGAAEPTVFTKSHYETKTRFEVTFEDADSGKEVYMKATYYSARGEAGQTSNLFKFTII